MNNRLDSTGLFIQQVAGHVQLLSELLMTNCDSPVNAGLMDKCIVSTRMLANSASLLDLTHWEELLAGMELLLRDYRDSESAWDERIAQIVSEMIEKEELLSNRPGEGAWKPGELVTPEEVRALATEVSILMSLERQKAPDTVVEEPVAPPAADEGADAGPPPQPEERAGNGMDAEERASAFAGEEAHPGGNVEKEPSDVPVSGAEQPAFIGGLISQLDISTKRLLQEWQAWKARSHDPTAFDLQKIKQDSYLIHFYALSLVETAEIRNEPLEEPTLSTLEHLRIVLDLYAALLSERDKCRVDIGFLGEENMLDVALLFPAAKILKCMISDISRRSSESYLRIEIEVEHRNGALWWCLRDNGNNFITDSRLDRDDFLAFYPGLREVKKQLEQFYGVLWVEPDEDHDRRFAFTMPLHANSQSFTVWQLGSGRFCMPSLQVCATIPAAEAELYRDVRGEYVTVEDAQVPLLRLSMLCSEAPEGGKTIVVTGSLEKRIAFYTPDEGTTEEGRWQKTPVPSWNGLSCGLAEFDDLQVPVIESARIVQQYLAALNSGNNERMSGSIIEDDRHALGGDSEQEESSEISPAEGGIDVLVVEKSEAVRDALASILSPTNLAVRMYDELSGIDQFLKENQPAVIISDFRDSTKAAKTIIDSIQAAGKNIPVILSTGHDEERATSLMTEIGASGYFLKPLDSKKVIQTLQRFVPLVNACPVQE